MIRPNCGSREKLTAQLAKLLEEHIISVGGNTDHRASSNKHRKELIKFFKSCLCLMPSDQYGYEDMQISFQRVLEERK